MSLLCRNGLLLATAVLFAFVADAQNAVNESGRNINTPQDGIYNRPARPERRILEYDYISEKDVLWEKRIWQVIDLKERQNQIFSYEKEPLIDILVKHAQNSDITLYSTFDDEFNIPLDIQQVYDLSGEVDTITILDPETLEETTQVVYSPFDPHEVIEYRIKEVWFFDEETSRLRVRILGIAPVRQIHNENGDFLAKLPMFWAYYPDIRSVLAQHDAFNEHNDKATMNWHDVFEMRYFSAHIIKESNVFDRRIQDYASGIDVLLEGEKIKESIRNYEHDLWEY